MYRFFFILYIYITHTVTLNSAKLDRERMKVSAKKSKRLLLFNLLHVRLSSSLLLYVLQQISRNVILASETVFSSLYFFWFNFLLIMYFGFLLLCWPCFSLFCISKLIQFPRFWKTNWTECFRWALRFCFVYGCDAIVVVWQLWWYSWCGW